jgi:hypothetical protein
VEKESCITLLQQFDEAIKPLIQPQLCTTTDTSSKADATILYVRSKLSSIFLHTFAKPGVLQYDDFTQQFPEIIDSIEPIILDARRTQLSQAVALTFKFDTAMLLPLHLTTLKCRGLQIRRRAIALLLICPVRESAWDGLVLAKVDENLLFTEEERLEEGGIIPEGETVEAYKRSRPICSGSG